VVLRNIYMEGLRVVGFSEPTVCLVRGYVIPKQFLCWF